MNLRGVFGRERAIIKIKGSSSEGSEGLRCDRALVQGAEGLRATFGLSI